MPPKGKKQKEIVQDDRFQAIVLTDSYETRFMPLTASTPRCLLPLCSVPLIEYTLEFLATAGVNEVYLMCSSHPDQIQLYIANSKWVKPSSPFSITTIVSPELRSVGDAMRDVDNRGLVSGDFLLVSGDVVTNIDFDRAMAAHRRRKALDKNHIATMILTLSLQQHRARSQIDPATFILDKTNDRCLYYQRTPPPDSTATLIQIDPELLDEVQGEISIRNDLIDCCVDICSPHVPQIFQENFDYQHLRSDFVRGVLTSDLLKKTIYTYILDDLAEYAARVESWSTYDAISQDMLSRWCYPLVPDANLHENTFSYEPGHIYQEKQVVLAQSCRIGPRTAIGHLTRVGDESSVSLLVVGRNCVIGKNVLITNSYVWDNCVIEDNATLSGCIVASGVKIGKGAHIPSNCVISFDVVIGADVTLPRQSRVCKPGSSAIRNLERDFSDGEESESHQPCAAEPELALVGPDGNGCLYVSENERDEDDNESDGGSVAPHYTGLVYKTRLLNISDDSIASLTQKKMKKNARRSRRFSATSAILTDYDGGAYSDDEAEEDFHKEAIATVSRALDHNHDIDTALLELNTLRMSMNVTYNEVRLATTEALLSKVADYITTGTLEPKDAASKIFTSWGGLYKRQVFNQDEQVHLLQTLQSVLENMDSSYHAIVMFVAVKTLYDQDTLEEEEIMRWWNSLLGASEKEGVCKLTGQFVQWLQEAEEESEESDEE